MFIVCLCVVMGITIVLLTAIILYQLNDFRFTRSNIMRFILVVGLICFICSFNPAKELGDTGTWFRSTFTAGTMIFAYFQINENLKEIQRERRGL